MKLFCNALLLGLLCGPHAFANPVAASPDSLVYSVPAQPESPDADRKKSITKVYTVDANDALTVDNQYGTVAVDLWDKPEVRIQITVTANADNDNRIQQLLDGVSIEDSRSGNQITIKTICDRANNWQIGNWMKGGERNYVKIDYLVSMPRQNALTVRNKFGNTTIPTFRAPLAIYSRYGNFQANDLAGLTNNIDVAYGNADIGTMTDGKIDIAYSKLELDKVNVLTLINKFGKLHIGNVGRLDANVEYSGAVIGTVRQSAKVNLSFSGGFRIEQFLPGTDRVDIHASYSSVTLPAENMDCDFDVTVSYGNFRAPSASHLTSQPDDKPGRMTKQYIGRTGTGTNGPHLKIFSSFGNVNFK